MEFEAKCDKCTAPIEFQLEKKASSIVNAVAQGEITQREGKARVSTMTQEGRIIDCPIKKVLELRRETLRAIDPDLEAADRRFISPNASQVPDPALIYFQERTRDTFQGQSYSRWDKRRQRTNVNG